MDLLLVFNVWFFRMIPKLWWCSHDFKINSLVLLKRVTAPKLRYLTYSINQTTFVPNLPFAQLNLTKLQVPLVLFLCSVSSYLGRGFIENHSWVFYLFKVRCATLPRYFTSLPNRGQRARSRAKTCRRVLHRSLKLFSMVAHFRKVHLGSKMSNDEKKKKLQKNMLRKKSPSKSTSGRKKPVIRSRDSKKSVWG